jgi:cold shock protein
MFYMTEKTGLASRQTMFSRRKDLMMHGEIVRLVPRRDFGFIKMEDGRDIFFHATEVKDIAFESLYEGQKVTFELGRDTRSDKERAVNLQVEQEDTVSV